MGAPANLLLLLPDSSQQKSSSTAFIDSPKDPSVAITSPPSHPQSNRLDLSIDSSSSFSPSLVPEIDFSPSLSANLVPGHSSGQKSSQKKKKKTTKLNVPERGKMDGLDLKHLERTHQNNACSTCAAGFTTDCVALCCCPFAIFRLLAFILVKFPSAVAYKMAVQLKKRLCIKGSPVIGGGEEHSRPSIFTPTWSYRDPSAEAEGDPAAHIIRFDTQNLLKHFEAGQLGFGCLSQKRD